MSGFRTHSLILFACVLSACGRIGFDAASDAAIQIAFQDGVAPTAAYTSSDATIRERFPSLNGGASSECHIDGDEDGLGADESALLRWDVSAIPATATIIEAAITLRSTGNSGDSFEVYELVRPWSELAATWLAATETTTWEIPGALGATDRDPTVLGTLPGNVASGEPVTVVLGPAGVAAVQRWVRDGQYQGIVIANPTLSNGLDLACHGATMPSARPRLTITYAP
jgi:hypothetical protein